MRQEIAGRLNLEYFTRRSEHRLKSSKSEFVGIH